MFDEDKKGVDQGESAVAKRIKESAKDIWLAGLGAFAKLERNDDEGFFTALVSDGKQLETATRKQIDKQITHVKDAALGKVDEIKERAVDSLGKLERAFDERVSSTLSRLHMPTKADVERLNKQVATLTAALNQVNEVLGLDPVPTPRSDRGSAAGKTSASSKASSIKTKTSAKTVARKEAARKEAARKEAAKAKAARKAVKPKGSATSKASTVKSASKASTGVSTKSPAKSGRVARGAGKKPPAPKKPK